MDNIISLDYKKNHYLKIKAKIVLIFLENSQ